jgi:organic hydroperoxide reductase OsmC/OhrA
MARHRTHHYAVTVEWTGNRGDGTAGYRTYGRDHVIRAEGKADIAGSADPAFLGEPSRWNPEDLLVASASACHKLWYLHLCADAGIRVEAYRDAATGTMAEDAQGGRFTEIVLRPNVTLAPGADRQRALDLHHEAHRLCFIANSLNVPIRCEPSLSPASDGAQPPSDAA